MKYLFSLAVLASARAASIITTSADGAIAYNIGQKTFFSGPEASLTLPVSKSNSLEEVGPLTVLQFNDSTLSAEAIEAKIKHYSELDDAWSTDFLSERSSIAISYSGNDKAYFDDSAIAWLAGLKPCYLFLTDSVAAPGGLNATTISSSWKVSKLPAGPFITKPSSKSRVDIHKAYMLERDEYDAYHFGTYPSEKDPNTYYPVDIFIPRYKNAWIPVPSRLWFLDDTRALAGMRACLKDIYDLKGIVTGGGSRAYAETYGPRDASASSVQILLDEGVIISGKTKTSQFAHGSDPWEFISYQYPFNPRGEGWLTAASSSAGSAAAIAAYPSLDFAFGSDTRGSVRRPAALVGSYGIRPTFGALETTGVIPLAERLDTLGFFCLDPYKQAKIQRVWYKNSDVETSKPFSSFPKTLLYPNDTFPVANPAAQEIFDGFVADLSSQFNMEVQRINSSGVLLASSNPDINNFTRFQSQSNFLAEWYSWQNVGRPLAEIWAEEYDGRYPQFDPRPRRAFEVAQGRSEEDYESAVTTRNQFRDYFLSTVLPSNEETCSESIFVYDIGTGGLPSYREEDLNTEENNATELGAISGGAGLSVLGQNYLASTSGSPDFTVPLGQVEYQSVISRRTEMVPVSIQLVAAPGCDAMLVSFIEALADKGIVKKTKGGGGCILY